MCRPPKGPAREEFYFDHVHTMRRTGTSRITGKTGDEREIWELRLYVAEQNLKYLTAFANLKKICEEHLADKYRIELVDLMKAPHLALVDQIVAIPTLVRKLPAPVRKIIGDLSNTERALVALDLREIR